MHLLLLGCSIISVELDSITGVAVLYSVTILVSACSVVQSAVIPDGELKV